METVWRPCGARIGYGRPVGPATSSRCFWESAGPPWSPPTDWIHENFGPGRIEQDQAYRERLQAIGRPLPDGSPAAPMSEREFATHIADPPWQYDNRASRGAAENHYPVMSTEDLAGLRDRLRGDGS